MKRTALVFLAAISTLAGSTGDCAGIEGRWLTFDDTTHVKRSIDEFTRDHNRASGRIVQIFATPDQDRDPSGELCSGDNRGRKIHGLAILNFDATLDPTRFRKTILDPEVGQESQCSVTVVPSGSQLSVRGYIGLAIFGRAQIWVQTE